ncbi:MAG: alpha-L-fucosidase [Chitinophagaceae bacterium]|nr:alpha-L-fucosidase [Chitinophagaceae bacterium]
MRKLFSAMLAIICFNSFSQTYQPNWQSLDTRPTPQWFQDGKFGIFIHWGVYAVPGWRTKGQYSEWYQQGLQTTDTAAQKYHKAKFGNRSYYDLANDFKAELFNPDEWAKVFEQAGAKYIVLTSKHHDGFTLWPSKEADRDWGFKWNAVDVGPKRDLLGDLFKAVRKTSVHAGMYYSLYEWFNPVWLADRNKYVNTHMWPQMKDLINNYQPDVFWTDGEWDAPAETWKSQEFLAWLYNESPVKDKIVVNDRWGSGIRFNHAGFYTPEYQPDLDIEDHYWEESRGMGYSYGYNRQEDAWDYNSAQSLVLQLIDKVSRGGNFLLDIGPDEHGKIPPIMQERLLQIGDWLKINGESIYNTVRWQTHSQWSGGKRDYKPKDGGGDLLLKLTVDPDPGYAVKEVFYSYNANTNSLFAIFPKYPDNKELVLNGVTLPAATVINFLSTKENVNWKQDGANVIINLPDYNPNTIKAPYAYVVKINNFGAFAKKPKINVEYKKGSMQPLVSMEADGAIHFTMDNSEPTTQSPVYTKPFIVTQTAMVTAKVFPNTGLPSSTATGKAIRYEWLKARAVANVQPGITYKYYEPADENISLESIKTTTISKTGITGIFSNEVKQRPEKFVIAFDGFIKINKEGFYTFFTDSDDGSKLFIDDKEIVDNDGNHGNTEKHGKAALKKGFHKISVLYFDGSGNNSLNVSMQPDGETKTIIPASILYH